jgi:hypothetical protein
MVPQYWLALDWGRPVLPSARDAKIAKLHEDAVAIYRLSRSRQTTTEVYHKAADGKSWIRVR